MSTNIQPSNNNVQIARAAAQATTQAAPGRYLNFTSADLSAMVSFIRANNTPHREMDGVSTRPLSGQPAVAAQVTVPKLEVRDLGNIGAPQVDFDSYQPSYEQLAGNLTALKYLIKDPQVARLVDRAIAETSLLGGKVNV